MRVTLFLCQVSPPFLGVFVGAVARAKSDTLARVSIERTSLILYLAPHPMIVMYYVYLAVNEPNITRALL